MKERYIVVVVLVALCLATVSFGQGSLTPPGAPAPMMKTLDEVEPRIPVSSAPISLTAPGSYYLTTNLSGTVTIASDNVSLDLMGFAINSTQGNAITYAGAKSRKNIWIHNGILLAPNANGIDFSTSKADANGRIDDLRISDCQNYGVAVNSGIVIRNVQVEGTGLAAIRVHGDSRVLNCSATACGKGIQASGTGALIENNRVWGNTDNYDFSAGNQLNILLCEVPESLDWPCSVKLAGTLTCTSNDVNGITVNSDDVSINLDGHTLVGPGASSGNGIYQTNTFCNLSVENGKVVEWCGGFKGGVYAEGKATRIHGIQASTNYYGIFAGDSCTVSDCTAYKNGYDGIYVGEGCSLSGCVACENGNTGIYIGDGGAISDCASRNNEFEGIHTILGCTVSDCTAIGNKGKGINVGDGNTVSDCAAMYNKDNGIQARYKSRVSGCATVNNTGDGIRAYGNCQVVNNICENNGYGGDGAGIYTIHDDNQIVGNTVMNNDRGIDVYSSGNFIARNTASGNTTNWIIASGNVCLVVSGTTSGAISGDSGGTAPGSTDPNANFTY